MFVKNTKMDDDIIRKWENLQKSAAEQNCGDQWVNFPGGYLVIRGTTKLKNKNGNWYLSGTWRFSNEKK